MRRTFADSRTLLRDFVNASDCWIIEGCYGDLIEVALAWQPLLIFLNPGADVCVAHCRARPWEPHKYESATAQEERLSYLLTWVRDYYQRDDEMSLTRHRKLFDAYPGEKLNLITPVDLAAPPASVQRLLEGVEGGDRQ